MDLSVAAGRGRSLSWRTRPFLCLAGAVTIFLGCLLPHFQIHADTRSYGGAVQSVTYDGLTMAPRAVILLAVLAAVLAAVSFGTGRRLRGGWVVVAIGGLLVCVLEVINALTPTDVLMTAMVQNGVDEAAARNLIDEGLYSLDVMAGVWFVVVGAIMTFAGAVLAIRDPRFRRCEVCRAVVRIDSYREHLNIEHPTGVELP
jgi:uncharacterized membrane protein